MVMITKLVVVLQHIHMLVQALTYASQALLIVMEERYTIAREALGFVLTKLLLAHVLEAQFIAVLRIIRIIGLVMEGVTLHYNHK